MSGYHCILMRTHGDLNYDENSKDDTINTGGRGLLYSEKLDINNLLVQRRITFILSRFGSLQTEEGRLRLICIH